VERLDFSVRQLFAVSEQLDGFSRESEAGQTVTIDVAADVLFAGRLRRAVRRGRGAAAAGGRRRHRARGARSAVVVGHTDSDASEAYNDDLSARRAQAVADVLGPALAGTA
jgi:flagellar motor protein MotB